MASVLKVDKLDPQSGTALEIGTSGDTISVPSGATLDISSATLTPPATLPASSGVNLTALNATNLGSGTVPTARLGTGTASSSTVLYGDQTYKAEPGGVNTPLFSAGPIAAIPYISSGVWTKVPFSREWWSEGGTYDTTNYRWTPGTAGKYFLMAWVGLYSYDAADFYAQIQFYKNGAFSTGGTTSIGATKYIENDSSAVTTNFINTAIVEDDGDDYWECYINQNTGSNVYLWNNGHHTNFMGFKLIE